MSNDNKPPKPPPDRQWHPVKHITFIMTLPIPGAGANLTLRGDITQPNVARWAIEYGPAFRHFRITYTSTDKTKEPQVCMVPEGRVACWEPLPQ